MFWIVDSGGSSKFILRNLKSKSNTDLTENIKGKSSAPFHFDDVSISLQQFHLKY